MSLTQLTTFGGGEGKFIMGKAYKLHEIRTTPCLHLLVTLFRRHGNTTRHQHSPRRPSDKWIWKSLSTSFLFCVFNDASNTHYTASNNLTIPHKEFAEMQKQVIVA